ncbi:MAG: phage holin family protein [Candidatus Kerfeldbacteria bacterium]
MGLIIRLFINALIFMFIAHLIPGFEVDGLWTAICCVIILTILNWVVRPLLFIATLPLWIFCWSLAILFANVVVLYLVAAWVDGCDINGFWALVGGAFLITIVNWLKNFFWE